jgi:hypothetical protein
LPPQLREQKKHRLAEVTVTGSALDQLSHGPTV